MRRSRVYGPYRKRRRWRLTIIDEGRQSFVSYATEAEAIKERNRLNRYLEAEENAITIEEALANYERYLTRKGNKRGSITTTVYRLRDLFFGSDEVTVHAVRHLTRAKMRTLYERLAERRSVDTHRNTLGQARTFLGWCVEQRHLRKNPATGLEGMGRRKRGKPQLRIDEARKLTATCLAEASPGSVGVLCALLLGLRASEVVQIVTRDLDDDGKLLWISDAKTEAGRRTLQVPAVLARCLGQLAQNMGPTERLFAGDRHWLSRQCKRLCRVASVPEVSPHGLRGTHASLVAEQGITGHVAAQALGHASYAVTQAHYVDPGAAQRGRQAQVLRVLDGGKTGKQ